MWLEDDYDAQNSKGGLDHKWKNSDWLYPIFWRSIKPFSATWNWSTWLQKEADKKGCDLCTRRKRCCKKRLGGNYLVSPGILSVINGPIWRLVRDHLKSSAAIRMCRTCQSAIINIGGFRVTLSPRFKCDTSKHISTLCATLAVEHHHGGLSTFVSGTSVSV